ncbi:MAG TPA: VWA domain-containing protein [Acidimicrobiales bacterium]|nr:VWA domain-containing protein [Acidimicrobiales bacterium]
MLAAFQGFLDELRVAGLPVSLTESLDAFEAVRHVDLVDRQAVREALAATVVKRAEHRPTFDTVFDVWFALGYRPALLVEEGEDGDAAEVDDADVAAMLEQVLETGDRVMLRTLARLAVTRYAGVVPGRLLGTAYHLHRTLRHLDVDGALARLLGGGGGDEDAGASAAPAAALERRLRADDRRAHSERFRAEVEAEVRRRLVAERGAEAVVRSVRRALPEDVDFMHATGEELTALRRALRPLARRFAVRLARRRRHRRRGPLDFRSTVRHSLSYGGVPAEPRFRHRRPSKPEIVVVADVSGSVAAFARFTLQFVHALSGQFSRVRSFVFVDGIDEVTRLFEGADDLAEAVQRVHTEADVVWAEGHSDYGHALVDFWQRWGGEITGRTTVVVLGDARNNYHPPEAWALGEVSRRARHVFWLNPEPRSYWDTGDSVVSEYSVHCDGVFECRNLRQLTSFVEAIA